MSPIQGSQDMALAIEDEAKVFANSLETNCRLNCINADAKHIAAIDRSLREIFSREDNSVIPPTTPYGMRQVLWMFRSRKVSGIDRISYQALKNLPRKGIVSMANLVNAILRFRHFTTQWKCVYEQPRDLPTD